MRLLIAEDEKSIAEFLRKRFLEEGFTVDLTHNGDEVLPLIEANPFDAVILDVMLPGRDGLTTLRKLREGKNATPVLILTARGEISEKIDGLNLGADDYLAKPFSMDELVARVKALLRRSSGETLTCHKVGDLVLQLGSRKITRNGRKIDLTPREYSMLEFMMAAPGRVVTRTQMCEKVWDYNFDPGTNLVDVYIQRLRRKVDDGEKVRLIQTVRGVGYCVQSPKVPVEA